MTVGSTTTADIQAVETSAKALYRRARAAGSEFAEIATAVRGLHTVLKHLRAEAEDPDSLLNTQPQEGSVYARQLNPIVEDCDFTLKQLSTIFEKYGNPDGDDDQVKTIPRAGDMESREKDMMALIRTKLANQKTNIDMFLDTVQLHNPVKTHPMPPNADAAQISAIKDKVDAIAKRLFRTTSPTTGEAGEEDLWRQFEYELVREGFSADVLNQNKEVLRAYIRELDSHGMLEAGSPPPLMRGLLPPPAPPLALTTAPYAPPMQETSPKEMYHHVFENEKFSPSVKDGRPVPQPSRSGPYTPLPAAQQQQQQQQQLLAPQQMALQTSSSRLSSSFERNSSDGDESDDSRINELALISTRQLMAIDARSRELVLSRMSAMHLSPQPLAPHYTVSPGTSPRGRYLPAPPALPYPEDDRLSTSPNSQALALSPRWAPQMPAHASLTPPPAYGSSPVQGPPPLSSSFPSSYPGEGGGGFPPQRPAAHPTQLAPDSMGQPISPDATWTRINRRLVSPEVLHRAGVRYEARPTFVAVLGVLSKTEIAEYARQSDAVRRSRDGAGAGTAQPRSFAPRHRRRRSGSTSDPESDLWDSDSDTDYERRDDKKRSFDRERYLPRDAKAGHERGDEDDKGTKVYPFIVPSSSDAKDGGGNKDSPAATVQPKPILKNKNENHVRFEDGGPVEISPEELAAEKRREERRRDRDRERDRDRGDRRRRRSERDRDREETDRDRDRDRNRDRDRDRERERERERARDRDRDYHGHRRHHDARDGRDHRDAGRDRREERPAKKSNRRDALTAVGIGGAAASLLSVLSEAAIGF